LGWPQRAASEVSQPPPPYQRRWDPDGLIHSMNLPADGIATAQPMHCNSWRDGADGGGCSTR